MKLEQESYELSRMRQYINSIRDMILLKFIFKIDNVYKDFTYEVSEDYLNKKITITVGFLSENEESSNNKYMYITNTIFNVVSEVSGNIFIESMNEGSINRFFNTKANKYINRRAIIIINCEGKLDGKECKD